MGSLEAISKFMNALGPERFHFAMEITSNSALTGAGIRVLRALDTVRHST